MCVKKDVLKRIFVVMDIAAVQPRVIATLPNRPLYHQVYEDTKNNLCLSKEQMDLLKIKTDPQTKGKMVSVDVPRSYLF